MEKSETSGFAVLFIGVGLLIFTFINAYLFLGEKLSFLSKNLVDIFGEAMGPLVETCIRVMYLGIMGWIGSIVTIRGMHIITELKPKAREEPKEELKEEPKEPEKPKKAK